MAFAVATLVTSLPFVRGLTQGDSFYFRDLAGQFLPLRRFVVDGLRAGELRFWNPYVHEGVPVAQPPISYPLDLLHLLWNSNWGISLTLALHIPLAAAAFIWLARGLGVRPLGAFAGACVYALGGFALSTINLYVYVKALAWAPLVILVLRTCAQGGTRACAAAALVVGVAVSTTGIEIVAQAIAIGLVLAWDSAGRRRVGHTALALLLGFALAAPTLLHLFQLASHSARTEGLATDVTLAQSIHPLTWAQVIVSDFHGVLGDIANYWWGQNFFPAGFPYILSLYLGAGALCVAAVGLWYGDGPRRRLLLLLVVAAWVCLGRYGGWAPLLDAVPLVRSFRYPSKAFFTIHFAVALSVALGLDALLAKGARSAWIALTLIATTSGALLIGSSLLPRVAPATTLWFVAGYFPSELDLGRRLAHLDAMLHSATLGGAIVLSAGAIAGLVWRERLRPALGASALAALIASDLLRTGAGLNPTVAPRFFQVAPQTIAWAKRNTSATTRIFTCDAMRSNAYLRERLVRPHDHERLSFDVLKDSLSPNTNVALGVRSALSIDLTMLVPEHQVLEPERASCSDLVWLIPRLRQAAISHVLSFDPLAHRELRLSTTLTPHSIAPLELFVYELRSVRPLAGVPRSVHAVPSRNAADRMSLAPGFIAQGSVAVEHGSEADGASGSVIVIRDSPGHIELSVETDRASVAVVRESYAQGWSAQRNGHSAPVLRADGRHLAVEVPPGKSSVVLRYRPPGLWIGLSCSLCAVLGIGWLGTRRTSSAQHLPPKARPKGTPEAHAGGD